MAIFSEGFGNIIDVSFGPLQLIHLLGQNIKNMLMMIQDDDLL
jgi:hypothetical protein